MNAGATVLVVPAAFMMHTGRDHWEVLLRARAIENQCYVVAAGQIGSHDPDRTCFGRSMIIDPWGTVVAQAPDEVGVTVADISPERVIDDPPAGAEPGQSTALSGSGESRVRRRRPRTISDRLVDLVARGVGAGRCRACRRVAPRVESASRVTAATFALAYPWPRCSGGV